MHENLQANAKHKSTDCGDCNSQVEEAADGLPSFPRASRASQERSSRHDDVLKDESINYTTTFALN